LPILPETAIGLSAVSGCTNTRFFRHNNLFLITFLLLTRQLLILALFFLFQQNRKAEIKNPAPEE
jgi:hypothetical protein